MTALVSLACVFIILPEPGARAAAGRRAHTDARAWFSPACAALRDGVFGPDQSPLPFLTLPEQREPRFAAVPTATSALVVAVGIGLTVRALAT
ncbi:hypothetical protein [Streptomyces sp. NK15101]|uniref:hypothetical protein n=1 Tax=Streptomyces sp. NK15101 TaxID=2873261 RepID=UPI001CECD49B|nr:hypothetical protein [Streptomyces sp. NK15101]